MNSNICDIFPFVKEKLNWYRSFWCMNVFRSECYDEILHMYLFLKWMNEMNAAFQNNSRSSSINHLSDHMNEFSFLLFSLILNNSFWNNNVHLLIIITVVCKDIFRLKLWETFVHTLYFLILAFFESKYILTINSNKNKNITDSWRIPNINHLLISLYSHMICK